MFAPIPAGIEPTRSCEPGPGDLAGSRLAAAQRVASIASPDSPVLGRHRERAALDRVLAEARDRRSATLVVQGAPGCGKSVLLEHVRVSAQGFEVVRCYGVESRMALAYAGLRQLCSPWLGCIDQLPHPQSQALKGALGLARTGGSDRFLVGLAVLNLLVLNAEEQPLLGLIEDAQWLDQATAKTLAFVARRLTSEPIALVFALRPGARARDLAGLAMLSVGGLERADAHTILASAVRGRLDDGVRDRIVAEAHGNPLALLELSRGVYPDEIAGGFAIPDTSSMWRIGPSLLARAESLPIATRQLLLTAAAEPIGDMSLLWRAAQRLHIDPGAAGPAEAAELIDFGARIRFRHPSLRAAIYHAAKLDDRRAVHRALAEATDPNTDPDRRAWHRAQASFGPDETVAVELERSADHAGARAGLAAAAAFHERAAELTVDTQRRGARCLVAAQAKLQAGAPQAARELLLAARSAPLSDLQRARSDQLEAEIAFAVNRGNEAAPLLLQAARRLEHLDPTAARDTYLQALSAAMFAGRLATGAFALDVARAALAGPPAAQPPRPADLLLDALAIRFTEGLAAAKVSLRRAIGAFTASHVSLADESRWLWLACICAAELWDDESWYRLSARYVTCLRQTGGLSELPLALASRNAVVLLAGELAEAVQLVDEIYAVGEATRSNLVPSGAVLLAAWRGQVATVESLAAGGLREAEQRGEGIGVGVVQAGLALVYNSVGRFADAFTAATAASDFPDDLVSSYWGLTELIEAGTQTGNEDRAGTALQRLSAAADASHSEWALGTEARCRALLTTGHDADDLYREAIDRLTGTRIRAELARAHLHYGEWLRSEQRHGKAQEQLRIAHDMFTLMGIEALADRSAQGLRATGENVRGRSAGIGADLSAQEFQIARVAGEGRSNLEIGTRLFLSPRTVEWHLGNVFAKLGITSRHELGHALADLEVSPPLSTSARRRCVPEHRPRPEFHRAADPG
jgi:DNA-binding CsgD family transcriptional regulator